MQISYENSIDHWIALQTFNIEQLKSLDQHDKKKHFKIIACVAIFFIFLNVIAYMNEGVEPLSLSIAFGIILGLIIFSTQRKTLTRKLLSQRLQIAYGPEFKSQADKTVTWDISPEQIIVRNSIKETRFSWDNIRQITICPEYLFIYFGFAEYAWLPKRAVSEADYNALCEYLVSTYQTHVAAHGKIANIVRSNWTLNLKALKEKTSLEWSAKKIFFTILWGVIFTIATFVILLLVLLVLMLVMAVLQNFMTFDEDAFVSIGAAVCVLGSLLVGLLGLILGLFEKLPGTRSKNIQ